MALGAVAIRADASTEIGTGHLMRCVTLADGLHGQGAQVCFLCRHLPGHLADLLAARGHALIRLVAEQPKGDDGVPALPHAAWLGVSQSQDARACAAALAGHRWDWLIVDHYALDACWETQACPRTTRLLCIDDLADRAHRATLLLDQNHRPDAPARYQPWVPAACRMLLGPRYALLGEAFRHWRSRTAPRSGPITRVLVFLGGVDAQNLTGRCIQALAAWSRKVQVDVVIGEQHPCRAQILADCDALGFQGHVQTTQMAALMARADLAIGAAGSATWERCCVGLPALMVSLADNQVAIARGLEQAGAGRYLGTAESVGVDALQSALAEAARDPAMLQSWSLAAWALADGLGVERILAAMEAPA